MTFVPRFNLTLFSLFSLRPLRPLRLEKKILFTNEIALPSKSPIALMRLITLFTPKHMRYPS